MHLQRLGSPTCRESEDKENPIFLAAVLNNTTVPNNLRLE
jgi:hypothetical protein